MRCVTILKVRLWICKTTTTVPESICCAGILIIDEIRASSQIEYITRHQTLIYNCLNIRVLEVTMYMNVQSEGPLDDREQINELDFFRHSFIFFCQIFISFFNFYNEINHNISKFDVPVLHQSDYIINTTVSQ